MAAKKTWDLIPLCHPLQLTGIEVDFFPDPANDMIRITSRVKTNDRTGVEMEAMVAVTHAALTLYDMCKSIDRGMVIREARLVFKSGGKSGTYRAYLGDINGNCSLLFLAIMLANSVQNLPGEPQNG